MVPFGQTLSRSLPAASDTSTVPSRSAATPNGLDSVGGSAWLYGSGSVAWYFAMSATTTGDLPGRSRYSVAPPGGGGAPPPPPPPPPAGGGPPGRGWVAGGGAPPPPPPVPALLPPVACA